MQYLLPAFIIFIITIIIVFIIGKKIRLWFDAAQRRAIFKKKKDFINFSFFLENLEIFTWKASTALPAKDKDKDIPSCHFRSTFFFIAKTLDPCQNASPNLLLTSIINWFITSLPTSFYRRFYISLLINIAISSAILSSLVSVIHNYQKDIGHTLEAQLSYRVYKGRPLSRREEQKRSKKGGDAAMSQFVELSTLSPLTLFLGKRLHHSDGCNLTIISLYHFQFKFSVSVVSWSRSFFFQVMLIFFKL